MTKYIKVKIVSPDQEITETNQDELDDIFVGYSELKQLSKGLMQESETAKSVIRLYMKEIQRLSNQLHAIKKAIKDHEARLAQVKANQPQKCPNTDNILRIISNVVSASKGKLADNK